MIFVQKKPWAWKYGAEKISEAVIVCLVSCKRTGRLGDAYNGHISHIRRENVPGEVWAQIEELRHDLSRYTDEHRGSVAVSTERMHHSTRTKHIRRLGEWLWIMSNASIEEETSD